MVKWVNAEERLPENQEHDPCNTYHVVKYEWENGELSLAIAMYMNNEWWINYTSKLVKPVKFWLEDDGNI